MTTGQLIKAARENAGLTQAELGEKIGVTGVAVMRYEKDLRQPRFEQIQAIADALSVDAYSLMSFDMALDAAADSISNADKYKAQITELMEKVTTEGLRLGKDVFEAIAGNPKYQWYDGPLPLDDEATAPTTDNPEPTPEGE